MPRKRESQARSEILKAKLLDFEFLKENKEFRADIDRLNAMANETMREIGARARETVSVERKWNLAYLPVTEAIDVDRLPVSLPISARIEGDEAVIRIKLGNLISVEIEGVETVQLKFDQNSSVDDLCALTDRTLRQLLRMNGFSNKSRRRFAETRFQLEVFRLAKDKMTFSEIARKLKRPIGTVQAAYAVACKRIGAELPPKRKLHTMKLAGFDPRNHFATCSVCSQGQGKKFCDLAEAYISLDYGSQRDLLSRSS